MSSEERVLGGILIGGTSGRMGRLKQLLRVGQRSVIARTRDTLAPYVGEVFLLGRSALPVDLGGLRTIPDVPGPRGPMAGILAALRSDPLSGWIIAACDMPWISTDAVEWLLSMRAPGTIAVLPRIPGAPGCEPLFSWYGPGSLEALEALVDSGIRRPGKLASSPFVHTPAPPADLCALWKNVNCPDDLVGDSGFSWEE